MKKHVRYYLVVKEDSSSYRKIESDLPFSIDEGKDSIMSNDKDILKITHIAKSKAELFLGLK